MRTATLLRKRLWRRSFPVNFARFLRTLFLTEHLWWLLLCITFRVKRTLGNNIFLLLRLSNKNIFVVKSTLQTLGTNRSFSIERIEQKLINLLKLGWSIMEAFSVCERVAKNFHHKSPRMKMLKRSILVYQLYIRNKTSAYNKSTSKLYL